MSHLHEFKRRPGWWRHRVTWWRWECSGCGYKTRTYDSVDRSMSRPIHPGMSVAVPGFNTARPRA